MSTAPIDQSMIARAIRAARLDNDTYEQIEHDPRATREAAIIVVVTSLLAGIGAGVAGGLIELVVVVVAGLVGWAAYAFLTYFIGTRLLAGPETSANWSELARTLGYANGPRALLVLGVVPALSAIVGLIVAVWVLLTTVVALRAALDFSTRRAIGTAIIGWLVQGIVFAIAIAA
ncbi:MAG: YIP1 family protein [Chloroflexi bacterium]|nr:YIP1 family protein [Chloroflexota bacterium]MDA1002929.1 YIP1 family protein [Chloroflexota bacterium]